MTSSRNRFAWERAVKASDLPPMTRLVLFALATEMDNRTRRASVSQKALAIATGTAPRTVRKHLAAAVDAGWLDRTRRGFRAGDDTLIPSTYVGTFPDSTGTAVPVEEGSTGTTGPVESESVPAPRSPEPAQDDTCTGTAVPTITPAHSEHCSGGPKFDDIDIEVHRQIKAKKDRGETIRNERALRASIRQDILAQRELDAILAEQAKGITAERARELDRAAAALGRNLAGVALTEDDLADAWRSTQDFRLNPWTWDATLDSWRERNDELEERSA